MIEQLWAPWRIQFLEGGYKQTNCIFCDFPNRSAVDDRDTLIVHRGELAYIILNAYPYSNGHLMVIPYRHTASLDALKPEELLETAQLVRLGVNLLKAVYSPEGFDLGMNLGKVSGAGVADHLHWHVVPRWGGDTNFMTVVSGVRVLPESLEVTYDRLRAALPRVLAGTTEHEATGERAKS